jgi:hypothetical protein
MSERTWRPGLSYEEAHDRIAAGDLSEVRNIAHVLVNERRYLTEECLDALIEWMVRDLVWPVDFAKGGDMFPASCRDALVDAWAEYDGGDDPDGQREFIREEAGWK